MEKLLEPKTGNDAATEIKILIRNPTPLLQLVDNHFYGNKTVIITTPTN
jgi:hypothetical protein